MHYVGLNKIDDFRTWLSRNNWNELLASIKENFLGPKEVQNICEHVGDDILAEVARKLDIWKRGFKTKRYIALRDGHHFRKQTPKWDKIKREITEWEVLLSHNKT